VVAEARKYMGTPYFLGGSAECVPYEMMDCSCLTMTVYSAFGIAPPDNPASQYGYGSPVSDPPQAGDLVFWAEGGGATTHVGIATGSGTAIYANVVAVAVVESSINNISGYVGARKLL
jgi:cell wall-associated NlpC family hydrolase